MNSLFAKKFFDLGQFFYRDLFELEDFPWEALKKLIPYLSSQKLGHIEGTVASEAYLIHPELISIGKGSRVEPGAYIEGPCILGRDCVVRHGAYVRGNVLVGDGCVIGHATEVKHSIFLDGAKAPHFNYVGDSILGNGVNLGAGAVCANLRFDRGKISVMFEGRRVETDLSKLGAILGDESSLGCHCVTNPGTLLGKGALCFPGLNVGGYIPPHAILKRS